MIMPIARRLAHTLAFMCGAAVLAAPGVHAQTPIRIGELNSYKTQPAFLGPYRMGMELAVGLNTWLTDLDVTLDL